MAQRTSSAPPLVTIRPAQAADLPRLAGLLVQLYAAELPGAFTGTLAGQRSLLHWMLAATGDHALHQRYVLCSATGALLATGMLQLPTDPPFERAPAGTLRMATTLLGYRAAARLLVTVARYRVGVLRQAVPDAVLVHSVVVEAAQRGRGLGQRLMRHLEQRAAAAGYDRVVLQVLASNDMARQLYGRLGYQTLWDTPRWARLVTWRSQLLHKLNRAREPSRHAGTRGSSARCHRARWRSARPCRIRRGGTIRSAIAMSVE